MVFTFGLVGGVTLVSGVWYAINKTDGALQEIAADTAQDLLEAGTPYVDAISAGLDELAEQFGVGLGVIADAIEDVAEDVAEGTLNIIENAGVSLLKAGAKTKQYFVDEVGDRRVQFVKQLTILIIVLMTTVFIYNSLMLRDR